MRISDWSSDVCSSDLHTGAKLHHVHAGPVDILAVQRDVAFDTRAFHGVVHPVQRPQEGGLATSRRADEGGHMVLIDVDRDILDRLLVAIEDVDVAGGHLQRGRRSEEHTSELQSLMRISYAVFCLKKK